MKLPSVRLVSLRSPEAAKYAEVFELTPELLAATGARYSRTDEGLDGALSKINPNDPDGSVDSVFKMVDYGHQSIADMAPVALFIDGISVYLAYLIWSLCPTAAGQETSTRYCLMKLAGLIDPNLAGISKPLQAEWKAAQESAFAAYKYALQWWTDAVDSNPELARIPSGTPEKVKARMRRNYAFDRARCYIPSGALTNCMWIMSARAWNIVTRYLLSTDLPEAHLLAKRIVEQLTLAIPRLLKHGRATAACKAVIQDEFAISRELAQTVRADCYAAPDTSLSIHLPKGVTSQQIVNALCRHTNRYDMVGSALRRTSVTFRIAAIDIACLRDLNRHRPGEKWAPLVPLGFYNAHDQWPVGSDTAPLTVYTAIGYAASEKARQLLVEGDITYVYWMLLGTQVYYEHQTTGNQFIYIGELRTGAGSHYRYSMHLRDLLKRWFKRFPETKPYITVGQAEPE